MRKINIIIGLMLMIMIMILTSCTSFVSDDTLECVKKEFPYGAIYSRVEGKNNKYIVLDNDEDYLVNLNGVFNPRIYDVTVLKLREKVSVLDNDVNLTFVKNKFPVAKIYSKIYGKSKEFVVIDGYNKYYIETKYVNSASITRMKLLKKRN